MARRTIGYHIVKSGYGLWLPGDDRGSWSSAWDELIGLVDPHTLNDGDPVRKRMAQERMKHKPVKFDDIKAIHNKTQHQGPIWAKGKWCSYIFDDSRWNNAINYIEQHNIRRGQDARPYSFITNAKLPV